MSTRTCLPSYLFDGLYSFRNHGRTRYFQIASAVKFASGSFVFAACRDNVVSCIDMRVRSILSGDSPTLLFNQYTHVVFSDSVFMSRFFRIYAYKVLLYYYLRHRLTIRRKYLCRLRKRRFMEVYFPMKKYSRYLGAAYKSSGRILSSRLRDRLGLFFFFSFPAKSELLWSITRINVNFRKKKIMRRSGWRKCVDLRQHSA